MEKLIGAAMLTAVAIATTAALADDGTRPADTAKSASAAVAEETATSRNSPATTYEPERSLVDHSPDKGRDVSSSLSDWLVRNHARPAGR